MDRHYQEMAGTMLRHALVRFPERHVQARNKPAVPPQENTRGITITGKCMIFTI